MGTPGEAARRHTGGPTIRHFVMPSAPHFPPAPALQVSAWLGDAAPTTLAALRGRVVVLHAFQMLCPACVSHGLPQASALHEAFDARDVAVLGLHTVFEHHAVMNRAALEAFVHEYRLRFPIAIDAPGADGGVPRTMQAYGLRGTPSLVLIDRSGRVRLNHFGMLDDIRAGAAVATLVAEDAPVASPVLAVEAPSHGDACDADGCRIEQAIR